MTDHSNCSDIGADILRLGGNAVDAAVAAGLCLTVVEVVGLVQDYLSYPVDVATTLSHENSVPFPSVTVCN